MFIKKYAKLYKEELKKLAFSYPKGEGRKFRINKENLDIIGELYEAEDYCSNLGKYLKAIYEEYSSLPRFEREQIFFSEAFSKTNQAIYQQNKLKVTLLSQYTPDGTKQVARKFYISPYKIVQDKTNTYNYIIGVSEEIKEAIIKDENGEDRKTHETTAKIPACFRLSRIDKIDIQVSMGAHISQENAKLLDNMLIKNTAMFMTSNTIKIKVKFTDVGLESFNRHIYLRPQFYEIDPLDNHIYIFDCTETQAINYFFKFGQDAIILEPQSLANTFKTKYEKALNSYTSK